MGAMARQARELAMTSKLVNIQEDEAEADIAIWKEALFAVELLLLHASPVYYGLGIPHGDNSGVVILPGFLGSDHYLAQLRSWIGRIGYVPYFSGIGLNAECPNILIQHHLTESIERALKETGRKIHLIGHSLGGVMARSVASQRPNDIASVTTLASPFRGTIAHRSILRAAKRFANTSFRSTVPMCFRTATPPAALVIFSTHYAEEFPPRFWKPQSTRSTTEWSIRDIAEPEIPRRTLRYRGRMSG